MQVKYLIWSLQGIRVRVEEYIIISYTKKEQGISVKYLDAGEDFTEIYGSKEIGLLENIRFHKCNALESKQAIARRILGYHMSKKSCPILYIELNGGD